MAKPISHLLSTCDFGPEEEKAVIDVVKSKWLSVGERTAEFERSFAEMAGAHYAVATSSCTAALHLALLALRVGPGDEVLVPSYTFVATANPILYVGATPVFVDICGQDDLNLDPSDLSEKIGPRAKAIIVVHIGGFLADMNQIMAIAERHGLSVVEDASHAVGAQYVTEGPYQGRSAGSIGSIGCFSFFANKNLVTGEGGMAITNDPDLAHRIRLGRSHGMTKTSWDKAGGRAVDYDIEDVGYNYRPTELTAALGLVQLRKLTAANLKRQELATRYREALAAETKVTVPFRERLAGSSHHIFPVLIDNPDSRNLVRKRLKDRGIQTSVHYPPVHHFTHFRRQCPQTRLPRTDDAASREITLPLHPLMTGQDVDFIAREFAAALKNEIET